MIKYSTIAATGLAGITTGCLTFVSAVDVRTLLTHVEQDSIDLIKKQFAVWWPCGRDLMVPLVSLCSVSHGTAYAVTKQNRWLISGLLLFSIGPYTGLVLGEDIGTLRKAESTQVAETTRRFCALHHVRTVLAMTAFAMSLVGLTE